MKQKTILASILMLLCSISAFGSKEKRVYTIGIKEEIGSTTWVYLKEGLEEARRWEADLVVLHLNTYGGTVVHADSMRMALLNSSIPVVAFVDMNAASAGALISLACDSIYMRPGASIGAATVVGQMGEAMPDKYQSYMRSTMRATAESHGKVRLQNPDGTTVEQWRRDPLIAEAMVDQQIAVAGVVDSGKVLTFTSEEALKHRYCEAVVESVPHIIEQRFGFTEYRQNQFTPSWWDALRGFLSNPAFQAVLIMIIIGGIYFELQTPGIGFPLLASVTAALLYFAPLYLDGFALYWEVILFVVGVLLIGVELFVIPGFGIAGVLGVVFAIVGLVLSLINNVDFSFEQMEAASLSRAVLTVLAGLAGSVGLLFYLSNKIGSKGIFRQIALTASLDQTPGFSSAGEDLAPFVGRTAVAATALRPSGKVMVDHRRLDAVALSGFVEAQTVVKIVKVENSQVYVLPHRDLPATHEGSEANG